jgi:ABC-type glycerol-3-phosphate transport system substrate-binding protein
MMLIAAYGGLPFDYRTDPATINFTDPATVDAIRQVLDLAADGYIAYSALTDVVEEATTLLTEGTESSAITTNTLSQFNFPGGPGGQTNNSTADPVMTLYPQGSQFGVIAYEITTGYIRATTQNPEATYRFLSAVASSPELFSGMPARQTLVSDPAVIATQGAEVVAVYQQLDTLLRSPNTVVFPSFTQGRGGGALSFIEQFWLYRAMDRYVLEGADLDYELAEAEMFALAYRECAESFVADTGNTAEGPQFQFFQQLSQCATSVDPTFTLGF